MRPSEKTKFSFQRNVAVVGILLFAGKLLAWLLTDSDAIFSDAMESTVNIIAAFMGLYSLHIASKPRDSDHPYGHGKIEFVTSAVEGALIIFAGIMIIIQAGTSLAKGNELHKLDWGIFIVAATAAINYLMGYLSVQKGIRENSAVLIASGKHLQSDTITTTGVVLSLVLVYFTKIFWIDALVALFFGGYIIFVGYKIIRSSLVGIMDEADVELLSGIAEFLEKKRQPQWIDVHNMKIQQYGSSLHIDAHLTLPWYLELRAAHAEMENIVKEIAQHLDRPVEFNFHMDDCQAFSCHICTLENCPVRKQPLSQKITWNFKTITQPEKHGKGH
ncbi:cation diffusion facilitator family transporter [Cruoricaptor ignavus]|uniref:Cation diffusion facilitator family transporter n=1 Tax=Cruoricaptor ignavus TaxID=1118202 RepID=A0A1M6DP66_9FLAO|nr:cation diffusion facilitator family transporter [Cruoricaptor ignavus]SHI75001.1 cation diffusion facilitator family transporter [Cruoricaptor ignavus]